MAPNSLAPIRDATARLLIATSITACLLLGAGPAGAADQFAFALWGDLPYESGNDLPKMKGLIDDMNASDIAFSLFDGDIKDGGSKCTDDVFTQAIAMFNSLKMPAVYVPGDNLSATKPWPRATPPCRARTRRGL
jgi:hypothetical protein